MSNLAERLREIIWRVPNPAQKDVNEAADALDACERALRAMLPHNVAVNNPNVPDDTEVPLTVTLGELRAVAAALAKLKGAK